jgi:hypothetical protein
LHLSGRHRCRLFFRTRSDVLQGLFAPTSGSLFIELELRSRVSLDPGFSDRFPEDPSLTVALRTLCASAAFYRLRKSFWTARLRSREGYSNS